MRPPAGGEAAMRWASAHSDLAESAAAAGAAADALAAQLGSEPVDLALAFFSASHIGGVERLVETLKQRLAPGCLAGVSAHGVVSSAHEIESGPALTVIAARLPGVAISTFLVINEVWAA